MYYNNGFDMVVHFLKKNRWVYHNQLKFDLGQYNERANRLVFIDFIHIHFSLLYGRCVVMDVKFKYPICQNMIKLLNLTIRKSPYTLTLLT